MKAPRPNFFKHVAALCVLLLCAAHAARAQEPRKAQPAPPPPTPEARTAITGRVVGESGEPVPEAAVSISTRTPGTRAGGPPPTVAVDENGGFRFEGLAPGLYDVFTSLPGFVNETDQLTGRNPGPYRPGDNVILRLVKGGVLTGTVTDQQGQPVASLNVRAARVRDLDGGAASGRSGFFNGEDRTDDRGVYRIYGLRPGLYVVYAGGSGSGGAFAFFGGYSETATFYPSGTRDTAAEVPVRAGQEVAGLDIRLREDPTRRVSGTIELPPGVSTETVGVTLNYASANMPAGIPVVTPNNNNAAERSFYFDTVADGEYDLQATVFGREGVSYAAASQRVSVRGADVTGLRLTLAPFASAAGTLRFEPGAEPGRAAPEACKAVRSSQLPQETLVMVAPAEKSSATTGRAAPRLFGPQSTVPDGAGAFNIRGLEAGRYRLSVRLFDEALYVRSIQTAAPPPRATATATAPRDVFDVKTGQQLSGLTVSVAEGAASFKGTVAAAEPAAGPPPFAQLRVHLVPQERERAEETLRYYETSVAPDGTFAFRNLAPGRYLVIARPFFLEADESAPRAAALDKSTRAQLRRDAETANTPVELQPCQRTNDFVLRFPPPPATK